MMHHSNARGNGHYPTEKGNIATVRKDSESIVHTDTHTVVLYESVFMLC